MIQKTAIIGMGALGLLYADIIASAKGKDAVSFIMDPERLCKYEGTVFDCNGVKKSYRMESCSAAEPVDFLIVAVKYNGLRSALDEMENCVGPDTVILSVMNGISSEEIIAERYGWEHIVDTIAQGMDTVKFGNTLTYTHRGELCIGIRSDRQKESLEKVIEFFDEIGMPYTLEKDMLHRIWGKFMLNVGVNQACMAYETNYGGVLARGSDAYRTMCAAMREVMSLADAEGTPLSEEDFNGYIALIGTLSPEGMPSMRQDAVARRYSEVEMFSGTVIKIAESHGIEVPANRFLYSGIKEIEAGYEKSV